jgi:tetratricopeptide (TPR) repeat protein
LAAVQLLESAVGPDNPLLAPLLTHLADGYLEKKEFSHALIPAARAATVYKTEDPTRFDALIAEARALSGLGQVKEAKDRLEQVLAALPAPSESPVGARARAELARFQVPATH